MIISKKMGLKPRTLSESIWWKWNQTWMACVTYGGVLQL